MKHPAVHAGPLSRAAGIFFVLVLAFAVTPASAQYFGKNKVQFDKFQFQVLATPHFDVYFYPSEEQSARTAARMAERWYDRLSKLLGHQLTGRQPLILYASHPQFAQTNVIESSIGEGTGGVTEGAQRRITLPLGASLAESDHVIGHELVHAFQYDILGPSVEAAPLWFIEGMAEYLSIGPRDPQTAMWLRDAALEDKLPTIKDLDKSEYFPYRWGQAFWAYVGGRWGDETISTILHNVAAPDGQRGGGVSAIDVIEAATSMKQKDLSDAWHASIREMYDITPLPAGRDARAVPPGHVVIAGGSKRATMNVSPALSPDGTKVAYLSEQDQFSVDLFLGDATTGRTIRKLISTAVDPHFDSLQFLVSAGSWHPDNRQLAVATIRQARPVIAIIDTDDAKITKEIRIDGVDEIFQPAWSPDGTKILFSGQSGGLTDLYVYDLASARTDRLTNDAFADLQPSWSPDGQSIVFVTDQFTTNAENLKYGLYGLATMNAAGQDLRPLAVGIAGNATNPHWLPDGSTIAFLSDATGRPDAYAYDSASGKVTRVATATTGVAGITPLSPALSVASKTPRVAYSVFRDRGFDVHIVNWSDLTPSEPAKGRDLALLPPSTRKASAVTTMLNDATTGLASGAAFETKPYKPHLSLVNVGQQIGIGTAGPFGTYASGGIALTFSDVLGNRLLGTSFGINGGLADVTAQVLYANRSSRWNWGVFGDRVPYLTGGVGSGFVQQNGQVLFEQDVLLQRQTYQQVGAFTAYPLSPVTRIEFSGTAQRISFTQEIETVLSDPVTGIVLSDEKTKLPGAPALNLFGTGAALVRDTSVFGATGPLLGQRLRLDLQPTFGDLNMVNLTTDFRQYYMPVRPITVAGRLMHIGRYGSGGEDQRLLPLFLGYPDLVRGYGINSFDANDCAPQDEPACPAFDRLIGSRVIVGNLEVRAPLVGLFRGKMEYGPVPIDIFAFADAGTAWTRAKALALSGTNSNWVTSVGGGARVNLLGFAVAEFNIVRALQRPQRGWMFVFNLRPGF